MVWTFMFEQRKEKKGLKAYSLGVRAMQERERTTREELKK